MEEININTEDFDKKDKKKKKEEKEELSLDRSILAFERTFLAWIRTAASLMTFGFAIYKLLQAKIQEPGTHPILQVLTPRMIAVILFLSATIGLVLAAVRYIQVKKRFNRFSGKTYLEPSMIQAYVILSLLLLLLTGTLMGN